MVALVLSYETLRGASDIEPANGKPIQVRKPSCGLVAPISLRIVAHEAGIVSPQAIKDQPLIEMALARWLPVSEPHMSTLRDARAG